MTKAKKIRDLKVAIGALAKVKKSKKLRVKMGMDKLPREACEAVYGLSNLLRGYNPMTVDDLLKRFTLIEKECGGDATIKITCDDYFGNNADITWYRDETDEEMKKRLEANKNKAAGQRKKYAADKKQKVLDEKAELARLQEKYSAKKA